MALLILEFISLISLSISYTVPIIYGEKLDKPIETRLFLEVIFHIAALFL